MTETPRAPESQTRIGEQLRLRLERERLRAKALLAVQDLLILASASPRRRALVDELGLTFEVDAADIPEIPRDGEAPEEFVSRAATEKAAHVAERHPGRWVLGADTVVALGDEILGKPRDRDDARRMLTALAGTTHRVCTGIALLLGRELPDVMVVSTEVVFRTIEAAEIEAYIDSGEPFDKAGSYGIQGRGGRFVVSVSGSYSNVMGLPLIETAELLSHRRPGS